MAARKINPQTIAEYIQSAPREARQKLRQMRDCIRAAAPGAQEGLKWGMPSFSYRRILVMFAVFKRHIGFYPTASAVRAHTKQLTGYKFSTGSIQFSLDLPLPLSLISRITAYRVRESQERDGKWRSTVRKK